MKWWDRDKFVKIFATILEGLIVFLVFTVLNGLLIQEKAVPFIAFFVLSFATAFVNSLEVRNLRFYKLFNLSLGIFLSFFVSAKISENYYQLVANFIVFLFLWYRGVKIKSLMAEDIINLGKFYRNLLYLFFLNLFAYFLPPHLISAIQKYSILYIILSIFLLFEVKNLKYHGIEAKISPYEWMGFALMLIATFAFSLPNVAYIIYKIYLLIENLFVLLATYLAYGMFWLFSKIFKLIPFDKEFFRKAMERFYAQGQNPENFLKEDISQDYVWLSNLLNFMAFLIAVAIIVLLIAFIIKTMGKIEIEKKQRDFDEEKRIDINLKDIDFVRSFKEIRNKILRAVDRIKIYTDSREKVRYYYKRLLLHLYQKKILERGNYSVKDICDKITSSFENIREPMERVSRLYEKVRYGKYYPKREEVEEFIKEIGKVMKL
ncbi:MAG: hypothetical protein ACPLSA_00630 [Caldanaerobacter sp.]